MCLHVQKRYHCFPAGVQHERNSAEKESASLHVLLLVKVVNQIFQSLRSRKVVVLSSLYVEQHRLSNKHRV